MIGSGSWGCIAEEGSPSVAAGCRCWGRILGGWGGLDEEEVGAHIWILAVVVIGT